MKEVKKLFYRLSLCVTSQNESEGNSQELIQ